MLKFNTMTEGGFSIQTNFKNWLFSSYRTINPLIITTGLHKTIIIVSLAIFLPLFIGSCKTCKCPAYSQTESQKPTNTVGTTV